MKPLLRAAGKAEQVCLHAVRSLSVISAGRANDELQEVRTKLLEVTSGAGDEIPIARIYVSVLCDLWGQGWTFRTEGSSILAKPPETNGRSPELEKIRLRAAHLHARDSQLSRPPIREFIRGMERRRLGPRGWVSIFSVMRDGRELASKLRAAVAEPPGESRESALESCISPYIQFVTTDSICPFTGLRLIDIWRYFRYTWSTPHNTTPGRRMLLLVRDRAAENHPIIGIAALASAIVQHRRRDEWIQWTGDRLADKLLIQASGEWARWLHQSLEQLIGSIYCKDLFDGGVITRSDIRVPTDKAIMRLRREAQRAWDRHRLYPNAAEHKAPTRQDDHRFWETQAKSHLFRAKRTETLAELLRIRRTLAASGFVTPSKANLLRSLNTRDGRRAIEQIGRAVKAAHVGIDMLDITVCGAIAPYAPLLGGKLVSLMLTSPEVTQTYERRYANAESVIASSMAGRPVKRRPKLVLLGTTSLYGIGSSQYNRLKVSADSVGGDKRDVVAFEALGQSAGYGSFHLSTDTVAEIESLLSQQKKGRRVNSIFGEGVSPRLRKIREGLDLIGLPADRLLQHGSPRIVYAVALATNFRDVLLGKARRAKYILPQTNPPTTTQRLVRFWLRRWLSRRVERDDVLKDVERQTLIHPIEHGARVRLPRRENELPLLAATEWEET